LLSRRSGTHRLAGNFARRYRAHNVRLDNEVSGSADHQKMLDIVAPDEDQPPTSVNRCRVNHGQPRLSTPRGVSEPVCAETPHQPCGDADQRQHNQKGDEKSGGQRHFRAEQALEHQRAPFFVPQFIGRESPEWLMRIGTICLP
jgi:hypothetical protein